MNHAKPKILIITGPTASGKTSFAAKLASELDGEIISADSRQVYRKMNLGTGKDYDDYKVEGKNIPYHLVDIAEPGYKYNVFEYQNDFLKVYNDITARAKFPIVCGGSGMYIDSIVRAYKLLKVPPNSELRNELEDKSLYDLKERLLSYKAPHNQSDTSSKKRAIRAIEIEEYYKDQQHIATDFPVFESLIIGIEYDRDTRRRRISDRLVERIKSGMVDEVKALLNAEISKDDLIYYGLEYKFITLYLTGELSYNEMFSNLETAIHQFAKRQMTWFRGMERRGHKIHWLDGYMTDKIKIETVLRMI